MSNLKAWITKKNGVLVTERNGQLVLPNMLVNSETESLNGKGKSKSAFIAGRLDHPFQRITFKTKHLEYRQDFLDFLKEVAEDGSGREEILPGCFDVYSIIKPRGLWLYRNLTWVYSPEKEGLSPGTKYFLEQMVEEGLF